MMTEPQITIRRFAGDEGDALYEAARESFAEISPWMSWLDDSYTREMARDWVQSRGSAWSNNESYDFAITDEDNRFLGVVGLNALDFISKRANLGYWVRTSSAGRGIVTLASRQLIDLAFSDEPPFEARLHRLEILVAVPNAKSHRVAQKLNAVREGVLRARLWPDGRPQDAVMYSVLKTDAR